MPKFRDVVYRLLHQPPPYTAGHDEDGDNDKHDDDDDFAFLSVFDTIIAVDDSYSMREFWPDVSAVIQPLAEICTKYDLDGIELVFFKSNEAHQGITSAEIVKKIFGSVVPWGSTPTGSCLERIINPYLARLETDPSIRPINIIILTDGKPTDDPEGVIIDAARRLDKCNASSKQVGIQFIQVGTDPAATKALKHLDDGLVKHGIRDMVDTVTWSQGDKLTPKYVLGGVSRKYDRESKEEI